ncbi:calmodulin-2/4 [Selaginella moellendorffii]|nr:calmodulin-2/4 [Selaginella moellendorffii]|eukprot:XP_002964279.2 calmodulin-2/4 [Selaginella moellendorffii]
MRKSGGHSVQKSKTVGPPPQQKRTSSTQAASPSSDFSPGYGSQQQEGICEFQDVLDLLQRKGRKTSKKELGKALESLGYNATQEELQEMIDGVTAGSDDPCPVDISYFMELIAKKMKDEDSSVRLREAFANFDKDKNGFISASELSNVLKTMGQDLTDKDLDRMIELADIDGDGQVNYEEFVNMMMARNE